MNRVSAEVFCWGRAAAMVNPWVCVFDNSGGATPSVKGAPVLARARRDQTKVQVRPSRKDGLVISFDLQPSIWALDQPLPARNFFSVTSTTADVQTVRAHQTPHGWNKAQAIHAVVDGHFQTLEADQAGPAEATGRQDTTGNRGPAGAAKNGSAWLSLHPR